LGGGGNGKSFNPDMANGGAGTNGLGGGGGGAALQGNTYSGGNGGSGVVIVSCVTGNC
jgi:hypothetical protein